MAGSLVATKLFVPRIREGVVDRRRLSERLQRGAESKLTLISAPAGFGKTTAVTAWLAARSSAHRAVAWLSLDKTDTEPAAFWAHVIAALQKAASALGVPPLQILQPGEHSIDLVLASVVNELAAVKGTIDLVLDDYHLADGAEVQAGVTFLLERLPPNAHVVITTRADPSLPIARMRTRGELVEIRAADLRFTADETATYLNDKLGLGLTARDVVALEDRTEGWIAALQLAGLSMQGRDDVSSFVAGFAGNDQYVFDYLVEEVLGRQSDDVRNFLLDTCFLDRLSGSLCDAVTGRRGSRGMLETLHRKNLFLVPLDGRREWYRYHHLFADVLLTQRDEAGQNALPVLHRRASDWYERHGERSEAVAHVLAAKDFERAAELIELAIPEMQRNRGESTLRGWARVLPYELVRSRPVLGIGLVGALAAIGEFGEVEERLRDVERCLEAPVDTDSKSLLGNAAHPVVVIDEKQLGRVPAAVELYRAAIAQTRGDLTGLQFHAQQAIDRSRPDDQLTRASAAALLGIVLWSRGDLEAALHSWTDSTNGLIRIGNKSDALGASLALADIYAVLGRLHEAARVYEQGLHLAFADGGKVLRGTADMHAGLSELCRERNDRQAARQHLLSCQELGEGSGLPQHPYRWRVAEALLRQDEGDHDGALQMIEEASRVYAADFFPNVRPVAAIRARVFIAQGRLDEATRWRREAGLGVDDELNYLREYEHIALARLLLAEDRQGGGKRDDRARVLLERLLQSAEQGHRTGRIIEISVLLALANRQHGIDEALVHLGRALSLAAPEGYVRVFINEGSPMEALLKVAAKRRIGADYTNRLLAALGPAQPKPAMHPDLIEALSERELDVLRLLGSDLGGPEIARELAISENTMRTHTKNIYEKLGVNSRRAAVSRAEELHLLTRGRQT